MIVTVLNHMMESLIICIYSEGGKILMMMWLGKDTPSA